MSVNLTLQALKNLEVSGELVVYKKAEFQGPAFFRKIVEFFDTVIFHNKVEFQSEATFTADTAGYAIIPAGNKKVDVTFTKPLSVTPVVTVTLKTLTKLDAYRVTNESNKGFTIEMVPTQSQDIEFSWTALSVSEIHTTKNEATPTPTPASPQPTPSASVSPGISTLPSASPSPTPATQSATIVISPSPVPSPSPTPTPPSPTASASSTLKQ